MASKLFTFSLATGSGDASIKHADGSSTVAGAETPLQPTDIIWYADPVADDDILIRCQEVTIIGSDEEGFHYIPSNDVTSVLPREAISTDPRFISNIHL